MLKLPQLESFIYKNIGIVNIAPVLILQGLRNRHKKLTNDSKRFNWNKVLSFLARLEYYFLYQHHEYFDLDFNN